MVDKEAYEARFKELEKEGSIRFSTDHYKIKQFMDKADASLLIASHLKKQSKEPERLYWLQWTITLSYYSMLYSAKAAILQKNHEVKTHDAAEIALGHLLIPSQLKKEDLETLQQAHKIFEDEYLKSFHETRKESQAARYHARPSYTQRQAEEIFEKARKFIEKIHEILA